MDTKYRLRTHAEGVFGDLKNLRTEKIGRGPLYSDGLIGMPASERPRRVTAPAGGRRR